MDLEKDREGNIVTKPITGWKVGTPFGSAVLLAIEYIEGPQQRKSIAFVMNPQQCLELVEVLKKASNKILEDLPTQKPS